MADFGKSQRQSSSIQAYSKKRLVTVAGKQSLDIPIGTLKSILKQASLSIEEIK